MTEIEFYSLFKDNADKAIKDYASILSVEEGVERSFIIVMDFYDNETPYYFKAHCVSFSDEGESKAEVLGIERIDIDEYIDLNIDSGYKALE